MNYVPCLILLSLLATAPLVRADDTLKMDAALRMDAALNQAHPAGVALAVDAAKVTLPTSAVLPGDKVTPQKVGALYGQATQLFGSVLAIAPPTITVVYSPPETPNPYDGMPPGQVMKLLTATFTPAQWKAFMSPAGVAYMDMAGDTQPPLFQALFPGGHLSLISSNDDDMKAKRDVSGDALLSAHLRLSSITSLALQQTDDPANHLFTSTPRPVGTPPLYFMLNSQSSEVDKEYGAVVRETIPNTPKTSALAFDTLALQAPVPLANIKTVDDLVTRLGTATHREIYADPRFSSRLVTLPLTAGPQSAPAADLLQALAFCVGGTYRRVGPAYVLTDDVVGLGTKHALWKEFEERATKMLPGGDGSDPTPAAGPSVPYTVRDISDDGDPLAFTPKQKDSYWKKWASELGQFSSPVMNVTLPFAQLSPAQQEVAGMIQEDDEKRHFHTTLSGTVIVQEEPEVEIMLPSVSGPIVIFQSCQNLLPYPALTPVQQQAQQKQMEENFPDMVPPNVPAPDYMQTLRGFSHRAARITLPKTAKEAAQAFIALQALSFNEAWLQVQPGPASGDDALRAQMTRAAAEGRKHGIAVLPALSLLHWPKDVSSTLLDCNILGQTASSQQYGPPSSPTVSPFAPAAVQRLTALVRTLGSVPGIGGMVWEDILATGYEKAVPGENMGRAENSLGYAEAGRLAFLRQTHADPMDVQDNSMSDERAQVHIPNFDGDFQRESRLFTDWNKLRSDTGQSFLRTLAHALPLSFTSTGTLLLPPSNVTYMASYGSWDTLSDPTPVMHFIARTGPDGQPIMGVAMTEKMSSALVYKKVQFFLSPAASVNAWKASAARSLAQAAKQGDKNIVVDLTEQSSLLQSK